VGHYDECREGYCAVCGQADGYCEHTSKDRAITPVRANERQHGGDHYKGAEFQHWDLIVKNRIGYLEGHATKYLSRWRKKNGVEDLQKSLHFVDKLSESFYDYDYRPTGHAPDSDLNLFFEENNIHNVDEIGAITILCTWRSPAELEQAKHHIKLLILAAGTLATG
jgi:hypothetical protein